MPDPSSSGDPNATPDALYGPTHQIASRAAAAMQQRQADAQEAAHFGGAEGVALRKRVEALEQMLKDAHGKNGINVSWPVISYTGGQSGGAGGTAKTFWVVESGVLKQVRLLVAS